MSGSLASLRMVLGGLAQHHWTTQAFGYADEASTTVPVQFATTNVYGLVEWRPLAERLLLQAGASWHWHSLYASQVSPRVAAVFQVTQRTTAKLLVSYGFRTPTLFEGYYTDGAAFVPSPGLTGDASASVEASLEHRFARGTTARLTLFDTSYQRLITQESELDEGSDGVPGPSAADVSAHYRNLPPFQVHGAQLAIDVHQPRFRLWGGVSVQDVRSTLPLVMPGFANLTANLSLSTNWPWRPITFAVSGLVISPRHKASLLVSADSGWVPWGGSVQASARWAVPWVAGLGVQLTLANILGTTLMHPVQGDYAPITAAPSPS